MKEKERIELKTKRRTETIREKRDGSYQKFRLQEIKRKARKVREKLEMYNEGTSERERERNVTIDDDGTASSEEEELKPS